MIKKIIVCDFDETITTKDTVSILGSIPYYLKPDLQPNWEHFINIYSNCSNNIRTLPIFNGARKISNNNFRELFKDELEYQTKLKIKELSSIVELEKEKIFKGIDKNDIELLIIRDQLKSLVRKHCLKSLSLFDEIFIISLNWSKYFISQLTDVPTEYIYCNDLILGVNNKYTGEFSKDIITGVDKLEKLKNIIERYSNSQIWYIGDSETDLLPILYPGVYGILLLNPYDNQKKFDYITTSLLPLDKDAIHMFQTDHNCTSISIDIKDNGNFTMIKDWKYFLDVGSKKN